MANLERLRNLRKLSAFSLVELLVSVSIISLMAVLSITAYPKFSAQLQASTESYKLLAWLRETQVYGISSYTRPGEKQVYGVEFDRETNTIKRVVAASADLNTDSFGPNSKFKNSDFLDSIKDFDGEEKVFVFKSNFKIIFLCYEDGCNDSNSVFEKAYIVYRRPNPEARIFLEQGGLMTPSPSDNSDRGSVPRLIIYLASNNQTEIRKKIVILRTGQMYVEEW